MVAEIGDSFFDGFEEAEGFRFDGERDLPARFRLQPHKMGDCAEICLRHLRLRSLAQRAKGAGYGGEGDEGARLVDLSHQVGKGDGVGEAFFGPPVGEVDVLFHPCAAERAVGEAVHRQRDIAVVGDDRLQFRPFRGVAQFLNGFVRKPQAHGEGLVGRQRRLHLRDRAGQRRARLRPALGRVDVQAIGEPAEAAVELHVLSGPRGAAASGWRPASDRRQSHAPPPRRRAKRGV